MKPYILTSDRLGLRHWIDSDTQPFIEMNKDLEVMKYFPKILSETETLAFIEIIHLHFNQHGFGPFAIEHKLTKQFMGFTGFYIPTFDAFFTPCVEIGWRFRKDFWGQGFASEAAKMCLSYGFKSLCFEKIVSFTASINLKSEKVMKRIGMNYIADFEHPKVEKDDALCRHVLYEITLESFESGLR